MEKIKKVVKEIRDIRSSRNLNDLPLRIAKLCEEAGEASGAVVSVLTNSYKNLTYEDIIEEVIDTWIVATDAMFAPIPGTEHLTDDEREKFIVSIMNKKIKKWKKKIQSGGDNS